MTRLNPRFTRFYENGRDLSSELTAISKLTWDFDYQEERGLDWAIKGGLLDQTTIKTEPVNGVVKFDTTPANSPLDWMTGLNGQTAIILATAGANAAPAVGDVAWCAVHPTQSVRVTPPAQGMLTFNAAFAAADAGRTQLAYDIPWGRLAHAKGQETAVNSAVGYDWGASSAKGGYMVAQIFSVTGTGSVTIKAQHAAVNLNANFVDIAGLTTGAIADTAVPQAVLAQSAVDLTINQYTRWQIVLSGITAVTFALALVRGR